MSFPIGNKSANTKQYSFPVTPFSKRNDNRIANFFRLRNVENELNDFIKFQEAEHARFNNYMRDMILREMYHQFTATYEASDEYTTAGVTIAAGASGKVPVKAVLQVTDYYNPDYYDTAWLQAFNCDVGGVSRITLNTFVHDATNHTLTITGGCFVFNPKTSAITVHSASVSGVIGKNLQKAYATFTWNTYTEKQ